MNNKDNPDEGPKIPVTLIIIILVAIGLFYFFSHRPPSALNIDDNLNVPLQPSSQMNENIGDNTISYPLFLKKTV